MTCKTGFEPEMLGETIRIDPSSRPGLAEAGHLALDAARNRMSDPMVLSWYESASGRHYPDVECCNNDRPGWLVYAQSRGGDLAVDVAGEYYFMMGEGDIATA